jgi:hypothetical protein
MRINADFDQPVVMLPEDMAWVASPLPGVERKMLDRIGDEVARATSLVRYAPGSFFDPHVHGGGEEFLVVEGIFSDEHGDYPAGTYVRNPIGTRHKPHSKDGCIILVKLHQFDPADTAHFSVHMDDLLFEDGGAPGVEFAWLHRFEGEQVKIVRWAPGSRRSFSKAACRMNMATIRRAAGNGRPMAGAIAPIAKKAALPG